MAETPDPPTAPVTPAPRTALLALLLLVPAPTVGLVAVLFGPTDDAGNTTLLTQAVWAGSKVVLLGLPVAWLVWVDKQKPRIPRPAWAGMPAGLISGVLILAAILGGYYAIGRGWIDIPETADRMRSKGLDALWKYALLTVYWCTINSLLEEYVWRWFVFTRCEALMRRYAAVVAAAVFFTIHHVIALAAYFDDWRVVVLGSLGVFVGGATWSWIYLRWRNLYAAYVSHIFADLGVFWIGYELIFRAA